MGLKFWDKRAPKRSKPAPVPPVVSPPPAVSSQPIRVTDERDGTVLNRGYSYWSNAFYKGEGIVYLFVGHADGQPRFFKSEGPAITRLGPLLGSTGTGEGMYWLASGHVMRCDGPRLRMVDPFTGDDRVAMDISPLHQDCRIWQAQSSSDGMVHSATVERIVSEGAYPRIGTAVSHQGQLLFIKAEGSLDESQVTRDGRYVVIKELDHAGLLYSRIVSLPDLMEYRLGPTERIGHSDCGDGFIVGEDSTLGGAVRWDIEDRHRTMLIKTWRMGHVSVRGNRALFSRHELGEIQLMNLDTKSLVTLVHHGIVSDDYDRQVRASLSPCGNFATYIADGVLYLLPIG